MSAPHRPVLRLIPVVAAIALVATGCATPAGGTVPATPVPTETAVSPAPTATAEPSGTPAPEQTDDIALPASCDDLFPAELRTRLETEIAPLNDPGVTMYSTEDAIALTTLESGVPSLRCTWGTPSDRGIATTVSIVSADQAADIAESLRASGFGSESGSGGEYFRTSQQILSAEEELVELGETHFLRGNAWVATRWVNYGPSEYTPGIVSELWP